MVDRNTITLSLTLSPRGEENGHVIASAAKQSHEEIAAPFGMNHTVHPFGLAMTLRVRLVYWNRKIRCPSTTNSPSPPPPAGSSICLSPQGERSYNRTSPAEAGSPPRRASVWTLRSDKLVHSKTPYPDGLGSGNVDAAMPAFPLTLSGGEELQPSLSHGEREPDVFPSVSAKFSLTYGRMQLNWSENSEGRFRYHEQRFFGDNGLHHRRDQGDF